MSHLAHSSEKLKTPIGSLSFSAMAEEGDLNDRKITIEVEDFKQDKELSLHFVIAWNSLPEPVDCSCWYAVDVPHEKIFRLHKKANMSFK